MYGADEEQAGQDPARRKRLDIALNGNYSFVNERVRTVEIVQGTLAGLFVQLRGGELLVSVQPTLDEGDLFTGLLDGSLVSLVAVPALA
jgi:hypothetical protein